MTVVTEQGGESTSDHASRRRRMAGGSVVLWGGTVAIGMSTAVLLAILSRHHSVRFTALSAILGLSFVISLIPSGVQLRAATLAADGSALPRFSPRFLGTLAAGGIVLSPLVALVLKVPVLAVIFIVAQLIAALPLAVQRGALIGVHRFGALGSNMGLESSIRVVVGAVAGLTLGIAGLAGALALATCTALVVLPRRPMNNEGVDRPKTSLVNASITLVLLGLFVQMDVLLAPSGLAPRAAKVYDLAATPSKGVYIALLAIGSIIFPFVRRRSSSWPCWGRPWPWAGRPRSSSTPEWHAGWRDRGLPPPWGCWWSSSVGPFGRRPPPSPTPSWPPRPGPCC